MQSMGPPTFVLQNLPSLKRENNLIFSEEEKTQRQGIGEFLQFQ